MTKSLFSTSQFHLEAFCIERQLELRLTLSSNFANTPYFFAQKYENVTHSWRTKTTVLPGKGRVSALSPFSKPFTSSTAINHADEKNEKMIFARSAHYVGLRKRIRMSILFSSPSSLLHFTRTSPREHGWRRSQSANVRSYSVSCS